ncbi:MAG: DUF2786 domain-containing protein [Deltaproteobacteria bacterium]|jgi:hypothetical protein|nr:DUF2786 domain-containing protein [Deltaproteobacteria bacterium]
MNQQSLPPRERSRLKKALMTMLQRSYQRYLAPYEGLARAATLDIRKMEGFWGKWIPEERVIALSEKLLDQSRWHPIKGILGHETAHQLVSDIYPLAARNEPPHGPTFITVCQRLKLDPFYWRASMTADGLGAAPPFPAGPDAEDGELKPVLDKVKKLLALAGSDNTNEAAAALSAAERILARHSLTREALCGEAGDGAFRRLRLPLGGRAVLKHSLILQIIHEFFGVQAVYSWNYDPSTGAETKEIELFGRPMNLAMGEYVWAFLNERCDTLWEAYRPRAHLLGEKGLGARNAFTNNLLKAFIAKMREGRSQDAGGAGDGDGTQSRGEVISTKDLQLDRYVRYVYPNMGYSRHSSSAARSSPNAAGAGTAAGRALTIHPPVRGGPGGGRGPSGHIGR